MKPEPHIHVSLMHAGGEQGAVKPHRLEVSWTQRDTVALCKESTHRRVLYGLNWPTEGKLLG
jgi:hypothetical protein